MGCCQACIEEDDDVAPGELTGKGLKIANKRLRKMQELDESTKVPFILVELHGQADGSGSVEICGKDEYGVYNALHDFLLNSFNCELLEVNDVGDNSHVSFGDRTYKWNGFLLDPAGKGTCNMGLSTMELVDFMCRRQGWTLGVVNGGNVGNEGENREQQVIFKGPHPMNLAVPHLMVELRSAGFVEICGGGGEPVLEELDGYLRENFRAERLKDGAELFCDRCYKCGDGVFRERGKKGENNMGYLTIQVVDFICKDKPWSLVAMNGGNYGENGNFREQQLVFRLDNHPLGASPHLMVEFRGAGYIEVNGEDRDGIYADLDNWLVNSSGWDCQHLPTPAQHQPFSDRKYRWKAQDVLDATADLTAFFHEQGWQLMVCSQGTVKINGEDSREQQIVFRPAENGIGIVEPHLVLDLRMGDGDTELFEQPDKTQVLSNQRIRLRQVGDCSSAVEEFQKFMVEYLGGSEGEDGAYSCNIFMSRGLSENNLGSWTMRICDYMVDRLGWSFVVCNICNLGQLGQVREQQLIFRYDGERREIPVTKESELFSEDRRGDYADFTRPDYWRDPGVASGEQLQALVSCNDHEKAALQELLDATFRRVLTRDRMYEYQAESTEEMPYRLELVHAFRSENVPLMHRLNKRREQYTGGNHFEAKTGAGRVGRLVNSRLSEGEALLFHGTNPSSSVSILRGGFVLSNAGKSTGTMFGYGVYLAECCSKSDEYARDDGGGSYPGLRSIVVCRSLVGRPLVVDEAGDWIEEAKAGGYDCVLGDRETKVGTYKELVFFDESQVVPEYSIIYKRQYNPDKVPEHMRTKTTGSTGRNWQVKLDKGWASIPAAVNQKLLDAIRDERKVVSVSAGAFQYEFDFENKLQRNLKTGKVREIRPPRVSS